MKLSVASPTRKSLLTAAAHIAFTLSAIVTSSTLTTAWAGPTDDDDANTAKTNARDIRDTVVVMGENDKAAAAAPSMSTLEATEPQSVVSQDFIDYSQPRTADFVSLLQITPSAGGLILWPVYAMMPLGFFLLMLQGISELIKRIAFLQGLIPDPTLKKVEKTAEEELAEAIQKLAEEKAAKANAA